MGFREIKEDLTKKRKKQLGTSLAVQWLRLHTPSAGDAGSSPVWGTKIPHAMLNIANLKNLKKKKIRTITWKVAPLQKINHNQQNCIALNQTVFIQQPSAECQLGARHHGDMHEYGHTYPGAAHSPASLNRLESKFLHPVSSCFTRFFII